MELQSACPKLLDKPREWAVHVSVPYRVVLFGWWAGHRSVCQGWDPFCSWATSVCNRYDCSYHIHRVVKRSIPFFLSKVGFNICFKSPCWQIQIFTLNRFKNHLITWVVSPLWWGKGTVIRQPCFAGDGGKMSSVSADCCSSFWKLAGRPLHVHCLLHSCCHHLFLESQRASYCPSVLRDTKNSPFPWDTPGNLRQPEAKPRFFFPQTNGVLGLILEFRIRGASCRTHEPLCSPFGLLILFFMDFLPHMGASFPDSISPWSITDSLSFMPPILCGLGFWR